MNSLKSLVLCLALLLATVGLLAQPQDVIWENVVSYQISYLDTNSKGEVVIGGYTSSSTPWPYANSFTISKYTTTGSLVWSKMLVCRTSIGIYHLVINDLGEVFSYIHSDGYPTYYMVSYGQYVELDGGLIKLSADGDLLWNISYYVNNPGGILMDTSGENLVMIHNDRLYGDIPSFSGNEQVFIVVLDPEGYRISYKVLYSNWNCFCSSVNLTADALYISGSFDNLPGSTYPPAILYFENTTGSGTTTTNLYEIDGNNFLAKLDIASNNWVWQRNIDHIASPPSVDDEYYYAYDAYYQGSRYLFKYSAISGSLLDFADTGTNEIVIQKLYTGLDGSLHFVGYPYSYGTIGSNLTITESYATSIYLYHMHSADALGNQYASITNISNPSASFIKFGYPNPYPVRPDNTTVTFSNSYPEVLYERDIPFVNIGNSPLNVSGFQFINATPGLTASVLSGSPAASGDTLWVRVSLNASYIGVISDTLVVNSNSPYVPSYNVSITGNLIAIPPQEPDTIDIAIDGSNVVVTWSAVSETIFNTPIEPDYYIIFLSTDPYGEFTFLAATEGLQFTQSLVANFQPRMFYRVVAYKYYGREVFDIADLGLVQGMSEEEVRARMKER